MSSSKSSRSRHSSSSTIPLAGVYNNRFNQRDLESKYRVWRILSRYFFQRYVPRDAVVLDIGAGFCEFINTIQCHEKIALDLNPEITRWAQDDVRVVVASSTRMEPLADASVDVAFASNFFEHLESTEALLTTLSEAHRVLRENGKLLALQPNIAVIGGRYWDFLDHKLPLTERSLVEALEVVGFDILESRARFLPYTTKSKLPQHPLLVWLYLQVPPAQWLLGGQAWVVARRR